MPILIAKAKAVALREKIEVAHASKAIILVTCDQIVLYRGMLREKPNSVSEAKEFLSSYSNDSVTTVSAVVVTHLPSGIQESKADIATVYWQTIPEQVIERVVARGAVFDSAGGFCIEDPELNKLIKGMDGTVDSVMGMPLIVTTKLIKSVLVSVANISSSSIEEEKSVANHFHL